MVYGILMDALTNNNGVLRQNKPLIDAGMSIEDGNSNVRLIATSTLDTSSCFWGVEIKSLPKHVRRRFFQLNSIDEEHS